MQPHKKNHILRSLRASMSGAWISLVALVNAMALVGVSLTSCHNLEKKNLSHPTKLMAYQAKSGRLEINSDLARELMATLERTGIQDTDQISGSRNFKAQKIVCQRPMGPRVEPRCWVGLYDHQVLVPLDQDREAIYRILLKIGGLNLPSEPDTITASAEDILCTQGVKGSAESEDRPTCILSVNRPQSYNIGGS